MKDSKMKWIAAAALLAFCLPFGACQDKKNDPASSGIESDAVSGRVSQDADGYVYESRNETVYAAGDVNIRSAATSQSEIVDVLTEGTAITRTAYNYSWSKVLYEDKICYVSTQYLTTDKPKTDNE